MLRRVMIGLADTFIYSRNCCEYTEFVIINF